MGRTKGLRPSEQRRLESILHRRHPPHEGADQFTLERLAEEVNTLKESLHLVLDTRGLCRLLWVGPLIKSDQMVSRLFYRRRRKVQSWRLISCLFDYQRKAFAPDQQDAVGALDLSPISWLRFSSVPASNGLRPAGLWIIDRHENAIWSLLEASDLSALCAGSEHLRPSHEKDFIPSYFPSQRVLLLTLATSDASRNERHLAELEGLVRSAGANPVAIASQKKGVSNSQTIWGKGKLEEVALEVRRKRASLVITDRELTPVQARNLERLLACPIMDRSELILDIFAQRASSSTGRLQVELAQLRYQMPKLQGQGKILSRQGGGIGTRGPGETQLEKDRRTILRRIERLGRDLRDLKKHRARIRYKREGLPRVALVGYTNTGKSTLLNTLCGLSAQSKVLAQNKLFATLDPTTRRLLLPQVANKPRELLITDTVGFIRELPAPLMEAFQATLEETLEADLLLLVVDLSNPDWRSQLDTVNYLLDSLGAHSNRQVLANKIDLCESDSLDTISTIDQKVLYLSATSGAGLQSLKCWLLDHFWGTGAKLTRGQR